MRLTPTMVQADLDALPEGYKTGNVDRLIQSYVRAGANASALRPHVLTQQQFHRIYYFVALKQMPDVCQRMAFIHENLLFSDWWHTDQLIGFVADLDFSHALELAKTYITSEDPFIRRWGYVLFISKLCAHHAAELLPLTKNDDHYYVQMAEAWLIAELAVFEPESVWQWMKNNNLHYNINGKAIQKISDSFRISQDWKRKFKELRPQLKESDKGNK